MPHFFRYLAGSSLALMLAACSTPINTPGPCEGSMPLAGCNERCSPTTLCATGLYCNAEGNCAANCNYTTNQGCGSGLTCNVTGQCVEIPDAQVPDGSNPVDFGNCPNISLNTNRVTPNVLLLVDRSGSMREDFGAGSRSKWQVMSSTLLDTPDGLISTYQDRVRFGFAMYTGDAPTACPQVDTIAPALNNYAAIYDLFDPAEPADDTPTGPAINALLDDPAMAHATSDPTIIVVATDGEPDECGTGDDTVEGRRQSVAAAARGFSQGVRVYMLAVGTAINEDHLTEVANAGVGRTSGPDAPFWLVTDDAGLRTAFDEIIGGEVSCSVSLTNGSLNSTDPAQYCASSDVRIDGMPVDCNDPNGWHASDSTHIEFSGEACDRIMNMGGVVTAVFPCDQATLF